MSVALFVALFNAPLLTLRWCHGSEEFSSRASCGAGGKIVVHDADTWRNNVAALAWAAQHDIPVWPIIFQAGTQSSDL